MGVVVGDRVGYTARFVRSVGGGIKTAADDRRGTVEEIVPQRHTDIARVRWNDSPQELQSVLVCNIARVGSLLFSDPSAKPRR